MGVSQEKLLFNAGAVKTERQHKTSDLPEGRFQPWRLLLLISRRLTPRRIKNEEQASNWLVAYGGRVKAALASVVSRMRMHITIQTWKLPFPSLGLS